MSTQSEVNASIRFARPAGPVDSLTALLDHACRYSLPVRSFAAFWLVSDGVLSTNTSSSVGCALNGLICYSRNLQGIAGVEPQPTQTMWKNLFLFHHLLLRTSHRSSPKYLHCPVNTNSRICNVRTMFFEM